jgi:hypothetical protein
VPIFTRKPSDRRKNVSFHPPVSAILLILLSYISQLANPLVLVFISSSFPDNFDDPEFIAESRKESKTEEKTRKPTDKAAGSSQAAVCYQILMSFVSKISWLGT